MSRFEPIGHFVYEKGNRIGCTYDEAAVEIAKKLNAYQMRLERLKAMPHDDETCPHLVALGRLESENSILMREVDRLMAWKQEAETQLKLAEHWVNQSNVIVERLTNAGDDVLRTLLWTDEYSADRYKDAEKKWRTAKEGKLP